MPLATSNGAARGIITLSNAPEFSPKTVLAVPKQALSGLSLLLIRWIIDSSYTDTCASAPAEAASAGGRVIFPLTERTLGRLSGCSGCRLAMRRSGTSAGFSRLARRITVRSGVSNDVGLNGLL